MSNVKYPVKGFCAEFQKNAHINVECHVFRQMGYSRNFYKKLGFDCENAILRKCSNPNECPIYQDAPDNPVG